MGPNLPAGRFQPDLCRDGQGHQKLNFAQVQSPSKAQTTIAPTLWVERGRTLVNAQGAQKWNKQTPQFKGCPQFLLQIAEKSRCR
mmetsp:Transcript_9708/g.58902  ORF Transcript_9708/g.58902 Transcript_9708/m.58902 type:complete len:85 (-) Transcript_9708:933-1187(-)